MKRLFLLVFMLSLSLYGRVFLPKYNDGIQAVSIGRLGPPVLPPQLWTSPEFEVKMPAEFEPSRGFIVSWSTYDWYTENIYLEMLQGLDEENTMYIVVLNEEEETEIGSRIVAAGGDIDKVAFIQIETNSCWIRDYAPIFVSTPEESLVAIDMNYYADRDLDDGFPEEFAEYSGFPRYDLDLFLEGGNLMTDGKGLLVVGDIIYENNPLNSPSEIDSMLMHYFGCNRVLAIESMSADGTGHIDMFAKFIDDHTVMIASTTDTTHEDYRILESNARIMDTLSLSDSSGTFDVVRIPIDIEYRMWPPGWVYNTYTNSLILDNQVFVPIFNNSLDSNALSIYQDAMPGYEIIPINSSAIIHTGGAIHCLAMQFPDFPSSHDAEEGRHLPTVSLIERIYPNPFNSTVMIETSCNPQRSLASIYDVMGRRVRYFPQLPEARFSWDARDEYGVIVSAGVYFIIIRQDTLEDRQKIIYAK